VLKEESVVAGFRVEGPAHEGGGRPAFHATVAATGERVTLKVLPRRADAAVRVRRALEVLAQLDAEHPRLVPLLAFGEVDGHPYAVLRRVEGTPLAVLAASAPLAPERAVEVVAQVARPLDALHARGLVHGDVGPEAVLVTPAGQAFLDDVGVTRALEGAPEWEDVDPRQDVRGLAVAAFVALTGTAPPASGPVPLVGELRPGTPHGVDAALQAALAPGGRAGTAGDLAAELRAALDGPVRRRPAAAVAAARAEEELAEIRRRAARNGSAPRRRAGSAGTDGPRRPAGAGASGPPDRHPSRAGRLAAAVGVVGAAALALAFFGGRGEDPAAPLAPSPTSEVRADPAPTPTPTPTPAEDPAEASLEAAVEQRRAAERAERRAAARRRAERRARAAARARREAAERADAAPARRRAAPREDTSPDRPASRQSAPRPRSAPAPAPAPAPRPAPAPTAAPRPAPAPAPAPAHPLTAPAASRAGRRRRSRSCRRRTWPLPAPARPQPWRRGSPRPWSPARAG